MQRPSKRTAKDTPKFADFASVHVLGAMAGQTIRGVSEADFASGVAAHVKPDAAALVEGVVLKVVRGCLCPGKEVRAFAEECWGEQLGERGWATKLGGAIGVSYDRAGELIKQMGERSVAKQEGYMGVAGGLMHAASAALHVVDGVTPQFVIVEPGAWRHYPEVLSYVENETKMSPHALWSALNNGKKALGDDYVDPSTGKKVAPPGPHALRGFLFVHAAASGRVEHREGAPGHHVDVEVAGTLAPAEPCEYWDVVGESMEDGSSKLVRLKLPPSGKELTRENALCLVKDGVADLMSDRWKFSQPDGRQSLFEDLCPEAADAHVDACFAVIDRPSVTAGSLKSMLQKAIRFGAESTLLPEVAPEATEPVLVDTRIFIAVVLGLLFSTRSSFVPDLGTHVRGPTAALKRLAVILVEDGWAQRVSLEGLGLMSSDAAKNPSRALAALMGAALAATRLGAWHPTKEIVVSSMAIAIAAHQSPTLIDWRTVQAGGTPSARTARHVSKGHMLMAARLLRIVRSFPGDMDMCDAAAAMVGDDGRISVKMMPDDRPSPKAMPLCHTLDFHVYRGIAFTTAAGRPSFEGRHARIFDLVAGRNPRSDPLPLAEKDPETKLVRAQQRMVSAVLFPCGAGAAAPAATITGTCAMPVDFGVLAAGVGKLGPYTVSTTTLENRQDGDPREGVVTWKLLVILGVESPEEVVLYEPTVRDNERKPKITPTAKARAIAQARSATHAFASPVLRDYNRARYIDGAWTLLHRSTNASLRWSYDAPQTAAVHFRTIDPPDEPLDIGKRAAMRVIVEERDRFSATPSMCANHAALVEGVVHELSSKAEAHGLPPLALRLRLLAMVRGQYTDVAMPTPSKGGGLGADQLMVLPGDWLVYLSLLSISRIAPGALYPKLPPTFGVPDARLLRVVEKVLADKIIATPHPTWPQRFTAELQRLEARFGTADVQRREPFDYQVALVDKMLHRDANAVVKPRGHFVSLDTGLGKTTVAMLYALRAGTHGIAARVVWFTKKSIVASTVEEIVEMWGVKNVCVVDPKAPEMDKLFSIVATDDISKVEKRRAKLVKKLHEVADTSIVVVDEVHFLYNSAIKTSVVRSVVDSCPRFVAMTATPTPARGQVVGERWIADSVGFPLTPKTFLVGAAQMVAARVSLDIEAKEMLLPLELPIEAAAAHAAFLRGSVQKWREAARCVREAVMPQVAKKIVELADADRAQTPGGGVLVFADDAADAAALTELVSAQLGARDYRVAPRAGAEKDATVGVAITTKSDGAGYNFVRVGTIVTGVYDGCAASRHQLRGRIRRHGQARRRVEYWTMYPKNTILELLLKRHSLVDSRNATLEAMAKEFVKGKKA